MGVAVSNLSMWEKQIQQNIEMRVNFRFVCMELYQPMRLQVMTEPPSLL